MRMNMEFNQKYWHNRNFWTIWRYDQNRGLINRIPLYKFKASDWIILGRNQACINGDWWIWKQEKSLTKTFSAKFERSEFQCEDKNWQLFNYLIWRKLDVSTWNPDWKNQLGIYGWKWDSTSKCLAKKLLPTFRLSMQGWKPKNSSLNCALQLKSLLFRPQW